MKRSLLLVLLGTLAACGGRAIETEPESAGGSPGQVDDLPAAGKSGAAAGPGVDLPKHELGDCTPGFVRSREPDRPCNWLTQGGQCFDLRQEACNCICPLDKESVCWSAFDDGPGSATLMHCK